MSIIRWAAVVVTTLMSLMNLGVVLGDPKPSAALLAFGLVVGLVGLVAAYGLARRTPWGRTAGLAVGAVNLVGAVVALATALDGGVVGLVVSVLTLTLTYLSGDPRRQLSPTAT